MSRCEDTAARLLVVGGCLFGLIVGAYMTLVTIAGGHPLRFLLALTLIGISGWGLHRELRENES